MSSDTGTVLAGQPDSFDIQAAGLSPITGDRQVSWLDQQHADYKKLLPKWKLVCDFYNGEVADEDCAKKYLIQRFQGEADRAYQERVKISDYTPHLGTLVDTLAGMLFAVEGRAARIWSSPDKPGALGDPADQTSPAHRLWVDADASGVSWTTLWRQFAIDIINYQYMWVLVDTVGDRSVVKLVNPTRVTNWLDGASGTEQVLMKECAEVRTSLQAITNEQDQDQYILFTTTGWTRWVKENDGTAHQLDGAAGAGTYKYESRTGEPTLPIFRVELPLRRYVSWILAKKAAVLFNQESVRDMSLRISNFSKLVLGATDTEQAKLMEARIASGNNIIFEHPNAATQHRFIAPGATPINDASMVLDKKIEHFWVSGFKMYADSAREKSATEVRQELASGVGAFLQLLKAAVDDAENGAFYRLEQAEKSQSPNLWGIARVERADDFSQVDTGEIFDQQRKRYFGDTAVIPISRAARIKLAKEAAQYDGLPADDADITNAVDAEMTKETINALDQLGVTPALVKARLTLQLITALGLIDPKEMITMADGSQQLLADELLSQAEDLALAQEQQAQLMAQLGPVPPDGSKAPPSPPQGA